MKRRCVETQYPSVSGSLSDQLRARFPCFLHTGVEEELSYPLHVADKRPIAWQYVFDCPNVRPRDNDEVLGCARVLGLERDHLWGWASQHRESRHTVPGPNIIFPCRTASAASTSFYPCVSSMRLVPLALRHATSAAHAFHIHSAQCSLQRARSYSLPLRSTCSSSWRRRRARSPLAYWQNMHDVFLALSEENPLRVLALSLHRCQRGSSGGTAK